MPISRWALLAALVACGDAPPPRDDETATADSAALPLQRTGVRFDPAGLRVGMPVGTLTVDSAALSLAVVDSVLIGTVRFRGELELSGRVIPHFDSDARDRNTCFEADSATSPRLPRWSGDERRPWFCFTNHAEAHRALLPSGMERTVTIVIDAFTIHRGFSDQVNTARFVRLAAP